MLGAFTKSGDDSTSGTGSCLMQIILTYLQERNDDPLDNAYLMLTFNDGRALPDALLRPGRFDTRIWMMLPKPEEREAIFKLHLQRRNRLLKDFDIKELVARTENWTGAEIEGVVKQMTLRAFRRKTKNEMNLLASVLGDITPAFESSTSDGHSQEQWALESNYLQSRIQREEANTIVAAADGEMTQIL